MIFSIHNQTDIDILVEALEEMGVRVGLTSGAYDLLHHLHQEFLEKCRRHCDFLIVGIDSDRFVRQQKGEDRPFTSEGIRVQMVNALGDVDAAFVMDSLEAWKLTLDLLPIDVVFKNDQFVHSDIIVGNASLIIIPDVKTLESTTEIVEEVLKRRSEL
jgi:D-beta-D-heptose 7-phosphate kinase/D-beta-D-heptose 1-phosphate adenosyltransferase